MQMEERGGSLNVSNPVFMKTSDDDDDTTDSNSNPEDDDSIKPLQEKDTVSLMIKALNEVHTSH